MGRVSDMIPTENVTESMFVGFEVIDFTKIFHRVKITVMETKQVRMECKSSLIKSNIIYHEVFWAVFPKGAIKFHLKEIQIQGIGMHIHYSHNLRYCLVLTQD